MRPEKGIKLGKMKKIFALISTISVLYFSTGLRVAAQHTSHDSSEVLTIQDADAVIGLDTEDAHAVSENELDYGSVIMHHISDDYVFQVFGSIHLPLPIIIYEKGEGFHVFNSNKLLVQDEKHLSNEKFYYHHGKLMIPVLDAEGHVQHDENGNVIGKAEARLGDLFTGNPNVFYNFSVTKNVFGLFLSIFVLLLVFTSVAKTYKKNPNTAPKGLQGMMEIIIVFVRDEIAKPFIGNKYEKFMPYLLSIFFFIWVNNLLGLIPFFPGGANVTGNIAVTLFLSLGSLIMVFIYGNRHFWGHILNPPGMPLPVKLLLVPIEFIGIFTKPFSLMIRLFANITAGHIIILSIIGITFIVQSVVVGVFTSLFTVAMLVLELLVAAIQAYIFTLLTAQMIGGAVEEVHHDEQH